MNLVFFKANIHLNSILDIKVNDVVDDLFDKTPGFIIFLQLRLKPENFIRKMLILYSNIKKLSKNCMHFLRRYSSIKFD